VRYNWVWHLCAELLPDAEMLAYCGIYTNEPGYLDWGCNDYVIPADELPDKLGFKGTHYVCDVCALLHLGNTSA
jgi:hypothetical protein